MLDPTVVGLVADELRRIAERGELASRAQLQEAVGIGAGDLELALDALRERGEASEFEPDGFGVPVGDEEGDVPTPPAGEEVSPPRVPGRGQTIAYDVKAAGAAQVSMPRAVAAVLDAAALGALLKAGIETSDDGVKFVFEVTP